MHVDLACTIRGSGGQNEDAMGYAGNLAWVIDGASAVFDERFFAPSDSAFLANELDDALRHHVQETDEYFLEKESLTSIVGTCLGTVKDNAMRLNPSYGMAPSYKLPTCAIGIVRVLGLKLEYYFLCDCNLLVEHQDPITDPRFQYVSRHNRTLIRQLGIGNDQKAKLAVYQATRKTLNTGDGYWVGSLDAQGVAHGITGEVSLREGQTFALYTDGFAEYFTEAKLKPQRWNPSPSAALEALQVLTHNASRDPTGTETSRPKGLDDSTIILMTA